MSLLKGSRRFVTDLETLAQLSSRGDDAGLVLGVEQGGGTVVLPLFQPGRSTVVAAVGDVAVAKVLVYRSLALGARVVVETRRPEAWRALTADVVLPRTTLAVVPPRASSAEPGSPSRPRLRLLDVGSSSRLEASMLQAESEPGGWDCRLIALDDLEDADVALLGTTDALIVSSLTVDQAESLVGLVDEAGAARLSRLRKGSVLLIGSGTVRDVELAWTTQERAVLAELLVKPSAL